VRKHIEGGLKEIEKEGQRLAHGGGFVSVGVVRECETNGVKDR
jgi:hypothetical protein